MWVWPELLRCIRSVSITPAISMSRIRHMSTTLAPWRSAISRTHSLKIAIRPRIGP